MKSITRHRGKITDMKRLKSSSVGNPRFEFMLDGYRVVTAPNSSYGYTIQNHDGKHVTATVGTLRGKTTLHQIEESA